MVGTLKALNFLFSVRSIVFAKVERLRTIPSLTVCVNASTRLLSTVFVNYFMNLSFLHGTCTYISLLSYNLLVHSSTGFSPLYLTSGSEARLTPDLIFGVPSSSFDGNSRNSATSIGSLSLLFHSFDLLFQAFSSVRKNLHSVH